MDARAVGAGHGLRIGELAARAGLSADTLRFYERRGLLEPAARTNSGYRLYDASALDRLGFIRRAQALGLTLDEVRETIQIAARGVRPCAHVRERLARRLEDVDARIVELRSLRAMLSRALARAGDLVDCRTGVCVIIDAADVGAVASPGAKRRRTMR
jgi:DNA-binding transcriptional MerR regulator